MIVCLHGFWGQPEDFAPVIEKLPLGSAVWAPDLLAAGPLSPAHDFAAWTVNFLKELRARTPEKATLVGYSMGGRLALHALSLHPELFDRALIVSAAPYYTETYDGEREDWEKGWARRFKNDPWDDVAKAWDSQPVFKNSGMARPRRTGPEMREALPLALGNWSARKHRFGPKTIASLPASVNWAFGALDHKYLACAKVLQDLPVRGQIDIISRAGHRILRDQPGPIAEWIMGR